MENNLELIINTLLEKLANGYTRAKKDWQADKKNPFKDGKFLGYYEAKETILRILDSEAPLSNAAEEIARRFNQAKADWQADKKNPFKDGKFLAYFEITQLLPIA